jgi:hypothetical protein
VATTAHTAITTKGWEKTVKKKAVKKHLLKPNVFKERSYTVAYPTPNVIGTKVSFSDKVTV